MNIIVWYIGLIRTNMWEQIRLNKRNSMLLALFMAIVLLALGYLIGELVSPGYGFYGLIVGLVLWMTQSSISFFFGDKIVLGISKARKIDRHIHPTLFNVVEEMKIASSLPKMPDIYIVDDPALNAFATGRKPEYSSVAVTSGLLEVLTRDELQGVIAHEIAHIKNRDVLYMTMVSIMMGTIVLLADLGLRSLFWGGGRRRTSSKNGGGQIQIVLMIIALTFIILSPVIAQLIYFAISRKREYLADASAVRFTRYPLGLAGALEKISHSSIELKSATKATAPMYIANPFKGKGRFLSNLSSTHPPLDARIRILKKMAGDDLLEYNKAYREITGSPVGAIPDSFINTELPIPVDAASLPQGTGTAAFVAPAISNISTSTPEQQQLKERQAHIERTRETTDSLWKLNDYVFIDCECETSLKIPPLYQNKIIECPHCLKNHRITRGS